MDKTFKKVLKKIIKDAKKNVETIAEIMIITNKLKNPYVQVRFNEFLVEELTRHSNIIKGIGKELNEDGNTAK